MNFQIIEKDQKLELNVVSKQTEVDKNFYFGAGWDKPGANEDLDLDIVCAVLIDGKVTKDTDYVYFGNRTNCAPGIYLSKDNTTGEGEANADHESIIVKTSELEPEVDKLILGLVAYEGVDLSKAMNTHYRVCDGTEKTSEQIADVKMAAAAPNDTAVVCFELNKTDAGWVLENKSVFHSLGQGTDVIRAFGSMFT